jgi:prolyl-tRNA editing enzyme YbaK/EbsC (Cys-tRNA(Pro) deacylase)
MDDPERLGGEEVSPVTAGISPFRHTTDPWAFIDPDLLQWPEVWAAAGTWHDVFGIEPHKLVEASSGVVTALKREQRSDGRELPSDHGREGGD